MILSSKIICLPCLLKNRVNKIVFLIILITLLLKKTVKLIQDSYNLQLKVRIMIESYNNKVYKTYNYLRIQRVITNYIIKIVNNINNK